MYLPPERREKTALLLSLNLDVDCDMFLWVLRLIKNDLVSSWDGMSQLFQITVMFVVNLKKSFKVIVEPEKTEQNKPDRHMY